MYLTAIFKDTSCIKIIIIVCLVPGKESFDAYISMFELAAVKIDTANRKDQATFITGKDSQ